MVTNMHTESIEYLYDGRRMVGHLALPEGDEPCAAVLVCHEGLGLDSHAKDRAQRLAALGYVAFALDYHGDGQTLEPPAAFERLGVMMADPQVTRDLGTAGLDVLLAQPRADASRVAAIGYCFGGTMALELARSGAELKATVGFHSGLKTARQQDAANISGAVFVCIGADDPMVSLDQRIAFEDEMRAGQVDYRINVYGGAVHSFTNERADQMGMPAMKYHGPADARSWRAMLDLFDEVLA
jgi:dienelactone hydrolase